MVAAGALTEEKKRNGKAKGRTEIRNQSTKQGQSNQLGLKSSWQSKDYMVAMRKYSGVKVMQIIGEIRYCDAKSKGVGNPSLGDGDLLRELVYKILH